jgi:hypothetical protein
VALNKISDETKAELKLIVTQLYFVALAIDHAGTAIAQQLCDVHNFRQIFSDHHQYLAHPSFTGASDYDCTLHGAWEFSFIFQIFAFLHYNNIMEEIFRRALERCQLGLSDDGNFQNKDISKIIDNLPRQLLQLNAKGSWDPLMFREGIRILHSFSFVTRDTTEGTYLVQPLVRYWCQHRIPLEEQHAMCQFAPSHQLHPPAPDKIRNIKYVL